LIGIVKVTSEKPRYEPESLGEEQWPHVLDVVPIVKVGRVSRGPSTDLLGITESFNQNRS